MSIIRDTIDCGTWRERKPSAHKLWLKNHPSTHGECIEGWSGRARGLVGGAFMGVMLAAQGGGPAPVPYHGYVADGLLAYWDGIDNTGGGDEAHSSTATTWADLSGNGHDLPVTQRSTITWTVNSLRQNQNGQYQMAISNTPLSSAVHVEAVFQAEGTNNTTLKPVVVTGNPDLGLSIMDTSGLRGVLNTGGNTNNGWTGLQADTSTDAINNWIERGKISMSVSSSPRAVYVDGAQVTGLVSTWNRLSSSYMAIGGGNGQWTAFGGQVFCVRVYSRALTAAEVAANYAVDAARFGLT